MLGMVGYRIAVYKILLYRRQIHRHRPWLLFVYLPEDLANFRLQGRDEGTQGGLC